MFASTCVSKDFMVPKEKIQRHDVQKKVAVDMFRYMYKIRTKYASSDC